MSFSLLTKVATKSMKSRKNLYFPYLLSVSILFGLFFIIVSLSQNAYLQANHNILAELLSMGTFFLGLISVIIALYASRFISQNQQKELGLYIVLGLEKKHINFILLVENFVNWLVTSFFSVLIGYGLGSLLFALLTKLMQDTGAKLLNYPFDMSAALYVILSLLLVFILVFITEAWKVYRLNVNELVSQSKAGESEPKSNLFLVIIGLLALAGGYYIALTTENVISAFALIFVAILLVIIGSYCLFTAGSIMLLKWLKRHKKYYYKPNHFLSVSGMLYRMKTNAISLATISILVTGVIITLTTTLTVYRSMNDLVDNSIPTDYLFTYSSSENLNQNEIDQELDGAVAEFDQSVPVENSYLVHEFSVPAILTQDNKLEPLYAVNDKAHTNTEGKTVYVDAMSIDSFNALHDKKESLKADQVLLTSNLLDVSDIDNLTVGDKTFETQIVDDSVISGNYAVEMVLVVLPDARALENVRQALPVAVTPNDEEKIIYEPMDIDTAAYVNIKGDESKTDISTLQKSLEEKYDMYMTAHSTVKHEMYQLYGGLLFIGLIVSIALIIGTVILLYFKQISEGYVDRHSYDIMSKVGLSEKTIKSTIRSQLFWIFGLPILVAIIHGTFSIKIMSTLLGLIAISDLQVYLTSFAIVIVLVSICYIIFYHLTSKVYYNIIQSK